MRGIPGPGRHKGVPNKATLELKAFTDSLLADPIYQKNLKARIQAGDADHIEKFLWEHRYGKPKEILEISGTMTHQYRERFAEVMADPEIAAMARTFAERLLSTDGPGAANTH